MNTWVKTIARPTAACWAASLLTALGWANAGAAATVLLKDGTTVRGFLVEQRPDHVVLEVDRAGERRRVTIPRDKYEELIRPVDESRLDRLRPDNPDDYRLYAEDLAEKHADPEAREMAIRLYLIAASLDTPRLGRSCLLGMSHLARSAEERARFQAMVFLLDPTHNRKLLARSDAAALPAGDDDQEAAERARAVLRCLRKLDRLQAAELAGDERVAAQLLRARHLLSAEDFELASQRICPFCERGKQTCEQCKGTGRITLLNGVQRKCPKCSNGQVRCSECDGHYRNPPHSPEMVRKLLAAELALLNLAVEDTPQSRDADWTRAAAARPPVRSLQLETITEFDPQLSVYRNGQWVAP